MEKITYKGNIIEVVEKEVEVDSKKKIFEYARRSPGVRVILLKDDKILLTKEFRQELQSYDHRLPGGKVFDSIDEYNIAIKANQNIEKFAQKAAIKEVHEEAGFIVKDISFIYKSVCGATINWDLYYFVTHDFDIDSQHLESGEDITIEWFTIAKAKEMCLDGSVNEERSALALLRYLEDQK